MPLKKHLIWVRWEDDKTKELMVFYGVILSGKTSEMSRQTFSLNSDLILHSPTRTYFQERDFFNYIWHLYVSVPPCAGTPDERIQSLARKVKNVIMLNQFSFNL
jgi:hypothetical protein